MHKKLSSIGEVILGHSFRGAVIHDPQGSIRVIQAKNVGEGTDLRSNEFTRVSLDASRAKALVKNQDVILTNRGTFRAAVFEGKEEILLAASSLYIIRMHKIDEVIPMYLAIFLNSREGQALLSSMNRGSLIRSLPKSILETLEVPVPNLETQQLAIDIFQNYSARSKLYHRHAQLANAIANQAISILISQ